ncbi:MAG: signal peptidase II, partial [Phascolarctobacterium sp.]|nr:signal peptidase II [Phascolarctobacterium sp.]
MNFVIVALLVVIFDQLTKYYVVENFYLGESVPVIENIFHWTYILNPGAAFGMLEGSRWFFVVIAVGVLGPLHGADRMGNDGCYGGRSDGMYQDFTHGRSGKTVAKCLLGYYNG